MLGDGNSQCGRYLAGWCVALVASACGGVVEEDDAMRGALPRDLVHFGEDGTQQAESAEGEPSETPGDPGRVISDDWVEADQPGSIDCACEGGPFEVLVDDFGTGRSWFFNRGPRRAPAIAERCGVVPFPLSVSPSCDELAISACNDASQCMQLRFEGGVATMNLWNFESDTVRVITDHQVDVQWQSSRGMTTGVVVFEDQQQGQLYDVTFSVCALFDAELEDCQP